MRKFDKATLFAAFSVCASAALLLSSYTPAIGKTDPACTASAYDQCARFDDDGYTCTYVTGSANSVVHCVDCDNDGIYHTLTATTLTYRCVNMESGVAINCDRKYIAPGPVCTP